MKAIAIHQPCYIPYLGVFYKIWLAEEFVYLDDAQYSNGYVFDWNRIKTPQGECRLKIPTERKFGDLLTEVKLKNQLGWREKHLKTIEMNYKKAPYFEKVFSDFSECIMQEYDSLAALNVATMNLFMEKFGWDKPIWFSSDMKLESKSEERVLDIMQKVGGEIYLSGEGGRNYQSKEHFEEKNMRLIYPGFKALPYEQQWGDFRPNMSVLDYCMNCGYDIENLFDQTYKEVLYGRYQNIEE